MLMPDRYGRYSSDIMEEAALAERARRASRTLMDQDRYEQDCAERIRAEVRANLDAEHAKRLTLIGGRGPSRDRRDPYPFHRGHLLDDPCRDENA